MEGGAYVNNKRGFENVAFNSLITQLASPPSPPVKDLRAH